MVSDVRLYRKRFIPDELLHLKDDKILYMDDELLITSWNTLKPRADMATGISAYYRKEGFKISRLADAHGTLTRWYCDICSSWAGRFTRAVKPRQRRLSGQARATTPSRHKTPRTALPSICRLHQAPLAAKKRCTVLSS